MKRSWEEDSQNQHPLKKPMPAESLEFTAHKQTISKVGQGLGQQPKAGPGQEPMGRPGEVNGRQSKGGPGRQRVNSSRVDPGVSR